MSGPVRWRYVMGWVLKKKKWFRVLALFCMARIEARYRILKKKPCIIAKMRSRTVELLPYKKTSGLIGLTTILLRARGSDQPFASTQQASTDQRRTLVIAALTALSHQKLARSVGRFYFGQLRLVGLGALILHVTHNQPFLYFCGNLWWFNISGQNTI